MECRAGCGACCIAISISSPMPGMPEGKPAGVRCDHLSDDNRCRLFGHPDRPDVCAALQASVEMCGDNAEEAFERLRVMEAETLPGIDQRSP
jgi:Fe-S-cluster containining protein